MTSVRVGLFPPVGQRTGGPEELQAALARAAGAGVDHLCVGDHVSFFVGAGSDGLITAASMLGIWVSPRRYATVRDHVTREAAEAGRDPSGFEHALNVWCGFAATREAGREPLLTASPKR